MPDKYKEVISGSPVVLAMLAAAGGCLVNYLTIYKQTGKLHFWWLVADLLSSCFIGWLVFGCLTDWGFSTNEATAATAIAGNLGTKVFSIIKYMIVRRLGVDVLLKEQQHEPDKRDSQL